MNEGMVDEVARLFAYYFEGDDVTKKKLAEYRMVARKAIAATGVEGLQHQIARLREELQHLENEIARLETGG